MRCTKQVLRSRLFMSGLHASECKPLLPCRSTVTLTQIEVHESFVPAQDRAQLLDVSFRQVAATKVQTSEARGRVDQHEQ